MALSESIICTVRSLLKNKDDRTATSDIYKHLYNYYTSSDIIDHYYESMKQLDKSSLDEEYQWIIFDAFHITTNVTFYNFEFRDKLCHVWLPIYESTLKELLSTQYEHEHLNSIKYIISNMIEMQQTFETKYHIIKRETQFENFNQKSQYFKIIKLVLPLLINPNILKQIENDHQNNIQLKWKQNNPLNTLNATPIYTLWIILKLIIMFIKTNEDCLTSVKHDQNIKNILLKSIKLIKDDNPLKLSIYTNLALLLNEDDIKNELDDPKEIIIALVANFKKGHYSVQENSETTNENEDCNDVDLRLSTNGVHIIDILAALRAFLQHDQVKNVLIENGGLQLLTDYIEESLELSLVKMDDPDQFVDGLQAESQLKSKQEIKKAQQFIVQFNESAKNEIEQLVKEGILLAVECLFKMSFSKEAAEILKKNNEFMSLIQNIALYAMVTSGKPWDPLLKAVDDLLYKLEQED